ncbi:hypothetical protein GPECTOR_9g566 [Gonium pectorale]|uniref:SET domain-containing protein n=1 Tax=Gonium pectorale TaxID=33097 RepID=A0A150GS05_GONPE|nr:hypothetical protein GPECTOR_9g566 [Gonium pectorale]|eukprot:KXZ52522.1 hypothetical protein GPECTOR_9g566 [Gonium pectorale]
MVLRGSAATLFRAAQDAALAGQLGDLEDEPLVSVEDAHLTKMQCHAIAQQLAQQLRAGALQRVQAQGPGGKRRRKLTHAQVLANLPELLDASPQIEVVSIGLPGSDPSPWDDCPAMAGQGSLRTRPQGAGLAAGELIGPYSCEAFLEQDWLAMELVEPAAEWDDPVRPCPHRCELERCHELGRYGADLFLPQSLIEQLDRLVLPSELRALLQEGEEQGKLSVTAGRLGCEVSLVNDPRRNLAARCDAEADFREGGPNAALVTAVVCGLLPVLVMVTSRDVPPGQHIMYSYGSSYWTLHLQEVTRLRRWEAAQADVEAAHREKQAAAAAREAERAARLAAEAREAEAAARLQEVMAKLESLQAQLQQQQQQQQLPGHNPALSAPKAAPPITAQRHAEVPQPRLPEQQPQQPASSGPAEAALPEQLPAGIQQSLTTAAAPGALDRENGNGDGCCSERWAGGSGWGKGGNGRVRVHDSHGPDAAVATPTVPTLDLSLSDDDGDDFV